MDALPDLLRIFALTGALQWDWVGRSLVSVYRRMSEKEKDDDDVDDDNDDDDDNDILDVDVDETLWSDTGPKAVRVSHLRRAIRAHHWMGPVLRWTVAAHHDHQGDDDDDDDDQHDDRDGNDRDDDMDIEVKVGVGVGVKNKRKKEKENVDHDEWVRSAGLTPVAVPGACLSLHGSHAQGYHSIFDVYSSRIRRRVR